MQHENFQWPKQGSYFCTSFFESAQCMNININSLLQSDVTCLSHTHLMFISFHHCSITVFTIHHHFYVERKSGYFGMGRPWSWYGVVCWILWILLRIVSRK